MRNFLEKLATSLEKPKKEKAKKRKNDNSMEKSIIERRQKERRTIKEQQAEEQAAYKKLSQSIVQDAKKHAKKRQEERDTLENKLTQESQMAKEHAREDTSYKGALKWAGEQMAIVSACKTNDFTELKQNLHKLDTLPGITIDEIIERAERYIETGDNLKGIPNFYLKRKLKEIRKKYNNP